MKKCKLCTTRVGKRKCIAVDDFICSLCCGTNRGKLTGCLSECSYFKTKTVKEFKLTRELFLSPSGFIENKPEVTKKELFLFEISNLCCVSIKKYLSNLKISVRDDDIIESGIHWTYRIQKHIERCYECEHRCLYRLSEKSNFIPESMRTNNKSLIITDVHAGLSVTPTCEDVFLWELKSLFLEDEAKFDHLLPLKIHLPTFSTEKFVYAILEDINKFFHECLYCSINCLRAPGEEARELFTNIRSKS